jgi:hypothetical protein
MFGILVMTNLTLGALFKDTWKDIKDSSQASDSFLVKLWKADSIQISKRVLFFFGALSLYASFVYPELSAAVGGGKLDQAEIIIRQDRRSLFTRDLCEISLTPQAIRAKESSPLISGPSTPGISRVCPEGICDVNC